MKPPRDRTSFRLDFFLYSAQDVFHCCINRTGTKKRIRRFLACDYVSKSPVERSHKTRASSTGSAAQCVLAVKCSGSTIPRCVLFHMDLIACVNQSLTVPESFQSRTHPDVLRCVRTRPKALDRSKQIDHRDWGHTSISNQLSIACTQFHDRLGAYSSEDTWRRRSSIKTHMRFAFRRPEANDSMLNSVAKLLGSLSTLTWSW